MKNILLLTTFLFVCFGTFAQPKNVIRIEVTKNLNENTFKVCPLGEHGFLLIQQQLGTNRAAPKYDFKFYDNDFNLTSTETVTLSKKQELKDLVYDETGAYAMFNYGPKFHLFCVNPSTHKLKEITGDFPKKKFWFDKMTKIGDLILVKRLGAGTVKMHMINVATGNYSTKPIVIPDKSEKNTLILSYKPIANSDEFFVHVNHCKLFQDTKSFAFIFDKNGEQKNIISLNAEVNSNIQNIVLAKNTDNSYVGIGTYAQKIKKEIDGIFTCKIVDGNVTNSKTLNFKKMKFYAEKGVKTLEKGLYLNKEVGLYKSTETFMTLHNLKAYGDGYLFVGESYSPNYNDFGPKRKEIRNPKAISVNNQKLKLQGYLSYYSFVAFVNSDGNIVWKDYYDLKHNPFNTPMKKIKDVNINTTEDIELSHIDDINTHYTRTYTAQGKLKENKESKLKNYHVKSYTSNRYSNNILWYDNTYLCYGFQTVEKPGEDKKRVFFVTKIEKE